MSLEKGWREHLKEEFEKPYFIALKRFIEEEVREGNVIYPPLDDVFKAFSFSSFEKTQVVIVGQDPYHGKGQAEGLSFSVKPGIPLPPSLKNIFKELESDLGILSPKTGSLVPWAKQGVLLLNATLTVCEKEPKSHYGRGWETFTDAVIDKLSDRKDPLVFILWGKSAEEKCSQILSMKKHPHLVLKAGHPSPFSVTRFLGCRHFSKTNEFLNAIGKQEIDWALL